MLYKNVVTSFLRVKAKILLLRRSAKVGTYQGRWAAISGYLEGNEDPLERARIEIQEEVGLAAGEVRLIRSGEPVRAYDEEKNVVWIVHPFLFETYEQRIHLNWEHSEYNWIHPDELDSHETVPKLKEAYERVRWDLETASSSVTGALQEADGVARDQSHGASFLARRALEILREVARSSDATSPEELFRDMLLTTLSLRKAQPSMATIYNLTGKLLHAILRQRIDATSVEEMKRSAVSLVERSISDAKQALEDVARNAVSILPESGGVLTHSYSSTVRRALELGRKSGRKFEVLLTESYPGLEGKELAKDLVQAGVSVRLLADAAVPSMMSDIDLVLVGADSVLADGSVINKIGTKTIAALVNERGIPFYVACEKTKFSTQDFLGEHVEISRLFDVTPSGQVSKIITEMGPTETNQIDRQLKMMLRDLYT